MHLDRTLTPAKQTKLQRVLSQVSVTALGFHHSSSGRQLVLAGQDNEVEVFDAETGRSTCRFRIFEEQEVVHGLSILPAQGASPAKLLAWGGRRVAITSINDDGLASGQPPSPSRIATATAPDWIYCGAFSPCDRSLACLATAHNEAVLIRHNDAAGGIKIEVVEVIAPARPGLYSASLTWLAADCVLVAAGTVFGEILVWKAWVQRGGSGEQGKSSSSSPHELLYVLTGAGLESYRCPSIVVMLRSYRK